MSRRIHIATGAPLSKAGGLHRVVQTIAEAQTSLGFETAILHTIRDKGFVVEGQGNLTTPFDSSDCIAYHFASTVRAVGKALPNGGRRVFHFHGPWAAEALAQGQGRLRYGVKYLVECFTYSRFHSLVTDSNVFADVLNRSYGVPRKRIRTVHPGVDVKTFTPGDRAVARDRLGLIGDGPIFACVRRLEPRMGIAYLVEAMMDMPGCQLVVAGDGSLRDALQIQVDGLGLSERVHLLGRVSDEDLVRVYQMADAVIVPSIALEGFGLIVLEAMACGAPVIATRVGGLTEALGPYASEWSVPPKDVRALVASMRQILVVGPSRNEVRSYAESVDSRAAVVELEAIVADD